MKIKKKKAYEFNHMRTRQMSRLMLRKQKVAETEGLLRDTGYGESETCSGRTGEG